MFLSRRRIWRLINSWWFILVIWMGFFSWAAFLYIGLRAKRVRWLIWGLVYLVLPFLVLFGHPDFFATQTGNIVGQFMAVIGLFSIAHAFWVRNDFLDRLEALNASGLAKNTWHTVIGRMPVEARVIWEIIPKVLNKIRIPSILGARWDIVSCDQNSYILEARLVPSGLGMALPAAIFPGIARKLKNWRLNIHVQPDSAPAIVEIRCSFSGERPFKGVRFECMENSINVFRVLFKRCLFLIKNDPVIAYEVPIYEYFKRYYITVNVSDDLTEETAAGKETLICVKSGKIPQFSGIWYDKKKIIPTDAVSTWHILRRILTNGSIPHVLGAKWVVDYIDNVSLTIRCHLEAKNKITYLLYSIIPTLNKTPLVEISTYSRQNSAFKTLSPFSLQPVKKS